MKKLNNLSLGIIGLLTVSLVGFSSAQSPSEWTPRQSAALELDKIVVARASSLNGDVIIDLLIPQYKIDDKGGETFERFNISFSKDENGEVRKEIATEAHTKNVQDGRLDLMVKCSVPIKSVHAFKVDGGSISAAELGQLLSKPRHVFMYHRDQDSAKEFVKRIERFHRSMIRPDAIILFVEYGAFRESKKSVVESPQSTAR